MPSSSPFLTARWVDLAMVNYEVDPALLRYWCLLAPSSCFVADGSAVIVRRGVPVR